MIKDLPTFCEGSPAKVESGTGARAVYIYSLKNLPYTVIIRIKDITVMNRPPMSVTAHRGMLSKKPQLSMVSTISCGKVVFCAVVNPAAVIIVPIIPCTILNRASISSIP